MRSTLVALAGVLVLATSAAAQNVIGRYSMKNPQGQPIVLVLESAGAGKLKGSLSGNGVSFTIAGEVEEGDAVGTMKGASGQAMFEASREGNQLMLTLVETDANGTPNPATVRQLAFTVDNSASAPAVGAQQSGSASAGGNPFAGGGASADKFVGTFAGAEITMSVRKEGNAYAGTIQYGGQEMPLRGTVAGSRMTGQFTAQGTAYDFRLELAGDGSHVNFNTAGTTHMLARKAAGNPLASGGGGGGAGGSVSGSSAQDQQLSQLLLSSAWCSFSYSGGSTYTGGSYGRTSTTRTVFSANGYVQQTSGSENTNTGGAGNVYGSSSGGTTARWRVQNGVLSVSGDGVQWKPVDLQVNRNSNGYPILKADGVEYMLCR